MHAILDAESDATLAFLDEWFARQGGRRGKAQRRTHTSGLPWARTRHATSRAGDPAPHDHVLIANLAEMLDDRGGWKALDTAPIRDLVHAATMAGRLAAAERAVQLGNAIEPDRGPSGKLDHWRIAGTSHVYVAADDLDQAVEDLTVEWSADRRQRWVLDVDEPAIDERVRRPSLARRTESTLRLARLRAEREAVQAVAPEAEGRLRSIDLQLRLAGLEAKPRAREIGHSLGR